MPKKSAAQKKTTARVMHEYKHGELNQGKAGHSTKVKSRKQAIAIALSEAGASNRVSPKKNKKNVTKTKTKKHVGKTSKHRKEGRT